jgi:DNA gyrase/topoisomerase IV subunit A
MLITAQGVLIRQRVEGISLQSRGAMGVNLMRRPEPGDSVVALAAIAPESAGEMEQQ